MKKITALFALFFFFLFNAAEAINPPKSELPGHASKNVLLKELMKDGGSKFLNMTPKEYKRLTGKKLTFKETIQLKLAQKAMKAKAKKSGGDYSTALYIIVSFVGFGWLLMGIQDDWSGNNWWVNLILTLILWLPGFIHSLVKMKDYTKD